MINATSYKNTGKEGIQNPYPWWYGYQGNHPSQPTYATLEIGWDEIRFNCYQVMNTLSKDKNGNTSDREMECLAVMGLSNTMRELATYRADTVKAKDEFYSTIAEKNMVSLNDVEVSKTDSTARNTLNVYLLGAGVMSNLITIKDSYMLPYTSDIRNNNKVRRES